MEYDRRTTVPPAEDLDSWVYKRRSAYLSQQQLLLLMHKGLSRRAISKRTEELKATLPVRRLPAPLRGPRWT